MESILKSSVKRVVSFFLSLLLVFQLFQNFRIGGIAGFRLFHRGKSQFFKQQFSQLTGGIDVEFPAGIGENQRLAIGNPPGKHVAELP